VPVSPAGRFAGQPGATALPGVAPGNEKVWSAAQVLAPMLGKLNLARAARYVGTTAVSTATSIVDPLFAAVIPVPAVTFWLPRKAR
jgi:hypothetical protein